MQHPAIEEACVFAEPDAILNEVPAAKIKVSDRGIDIHALHEYCSQRLASYKVPTQIYIVEELPKTYNGKLKRYLSGSECRDLFVDISDKVIVVTGSPKIGKSLVEAFAHENAKVVINYCHSEKAANELHHQIRQYNENCIVVKADVTKREDVVRLYQETYERFGRVDALINNAGVCEDHAIRDMEEDSWKRVMDVNLTGAYLCSRVFAEAMIRQKEGTIVNIASIKGLEGCANQVNYSAPKRA